MYIEKKNMRRLYLFTSLFLFAHSCLAQRFVPVFIDSDNLHLSKQMPENFNGEWVADACVINEEVYLLSSELAPGASVYRMVNDDLIPEEGYEFIVDDLNTGTRFVQVNEFTFVTGSKAPDSLSPAVVKVHDGQGWGNLGTLPSYKINDFEQYEGSFIAGIHGNTSTSGLYEWNGLEWVVFPQPIEGRVYCLEVFDGDLYVGGDFSIDGMGIANLAKLGENGWEQVGDGVNGAVFDLHVFEGMLFCGGEFSSDAAGVIMYPGLMVISDEGNYSPDWAMLTTGTGNQKKVRIFDSQGDLYISEGHQASMTVNQTWMIRNESVTGFKEHQPARVIHHNGVKYVVSGRLNVSGFSTSMYSETPFLREIETGVNTHVLTNDDIWAWIKTSAAQLRRPGDLTGFTTEPSFGPTDVLKGTIYSAGFWSSGLSEGLVYASDNTYSYSNSIDSPRITTYGPHSECYNEDYLNRYYRVWPLSKEMIESHQMHYNDDSYSIPEVIQNYPGNGRSWCNESSMLAPFADLNGNGLYEPTLGEYPIIHGDFSVITITNESMVSNNEAPGLESVIEYSMKVDSGLPISQTMFIHANIRNRSGRDYEDFSIGFFADFDIGYQLDDFVGCSPSQNYFFGYNGDAFDEPGLLSPGYAELIPACGVKFLNRPMDAFRSFNWGTNPLLGVPVTSEQIHHLLNGRLNDGTSMVFGGLGIPEQSWLPDSVVHYQYSGNPQGSFPIWNEAMGGNPPGGRNGVGSTHIGSFEDRSSVCLDLAVVNSFPINQSILYNATEILAVHMSEITAEYDVTGNACFWEENELSTGLLSDEGISLTLYPNPNMGEFTIRHNYTGRLNWRVINNSGQEWMRGISSSSREVISVRDLPPGLYYFVCTAESKWIEGVKFLVIR